MDIVEQIENIPFRVPGDIFDRACDSIIMERLIADKLYRALNSILDATGANEYAMPVVLDALESYALTRLA